MIINDTKMHGCTWLLFVSLLGTALIDFCRLEFWPVELMTCPPIRVEGFFDSDLGSFSQIFLKSQRDTIVLEWVLEIEEVLDSTASLESDANRQSPGKGEMPWFQADRFDPPKKKPTFF